MLICESSKMLITENGSPAKKHQERTRLELKGLLRGSGQSMERIDASARAKAGGLAAALNSDRGPR